MLPVAWACPPLGWLSSLSSAPSHTSLPEAGSQDALPADFQASTVESITCKGLGTHPGNSVPILGSGSSASRVQLS